MIKRNTREQRAPMSEYNRKQWRLVLAELILLGLTFFACIIVNLLRGG